MTARNSQAQEIYLAASQIESLPERQAYVRQACQDDGALKRQVDALVAAHGRAQDSHTPVGESSHEARTTDFTRTRLDPTEEQLGTIISGRYKVLERLGEGGMGMVYVAEQIAPVRRKVALKVVKAGMDSARVLARFEAERQALALMDHTNIAKVFDGGLTDRKLPFFVMEYIKGVPLTEYCDSARLTVRQRLELFVQVCEAVQHAHQKGVIHRDLKPSNILVALYDGRPVPKVIDFGLAKAIHQPLTDRTLYTAHELVLGTPLYMSPEQAKLNNLDIDTRTDVYALGVILYELLTGTTPLERRRLQHADWDEVRRVIREEDPPKPSTKLSASETLPALAAQRRVEPIELARLLRGELDWIVLKALAKERDQRYETANALARDVQAYLADEPVLAGPVRSSYRLRKFLKKHRGPALVAAILLAAITAGGGVSAFLAVRATRAERATREAAEAEGEQRRRAEAVADLLVRAFRKPDPSVAGKDLKVVEILGQAVDDLNGTADMHPLTRAALQNAVGQTYLGLGEAAAARQILRSAHDARREALGPDHPDTLASLHHLAEAHWAAGEEDKAIELFEACLHARRARLGDAHPDTLTTLISFADLYETGPERYRAVTLLEECIDTCRAQLGDEHPVTVRCLDSLAEGYRYAGEFARAVPLFEECLEKRRTAQGAEHPDTLVTSNRLAYAYMDVWQFSKAVPLFERCLRVRRAKLGEDHPDTLTTLEQLGTACRHTGDYSRAVASFVESLRLRSRKLGDEHPDTITGLRCLAAAYRYAGEFDLASAQVEEGLRRRRAKGGDTDIGYLLLLNEQGSLYRDAGQPTRAVPILEECVRGYQTLLGDDHPDTLIISGNLATAYQKAGQTGKAVALLEERVRRSKVKPGEDHAETLTALSLLGAAYRDHGEPERAVLVLNVCLDRLRDQLGADSPYTLDAALTLATANLALGKVSLAVADLEQCVATARLKFGNAHPRSLAASHYLACAYRAAGDPARAQLLLEETLRLREARLGRQHPDTLATLGTLAELLEEHSQNDTERDQPKRHSPEGDRAETLDLLSGHDDPP